MHVQGCLLFKGFAADLARVRSFAGMGASMLVPRCPRGKTTAAYITNKFLDAVVDLTHVSPHVGRRSKALVADRTVVGSCTCVNVAVDQQIIRGGEYFSAFFTFVGSAIVLCDLRAS